MTTQEYTIRESTQLVLDGVHIAVGNLVRLEYVDEQGVSRQGITAMLWVLVPGQSPNRQRVHIGQNVRVNGMSLRVLEIGVADGWGFVRLAVDRE